MISRVRHVLDTPTLFTVINSLVFSSLFYCSSVLSGTCKGNIAKLQLVQNFAARLLSGKRKFDHITPTLKQLKLLPVSDLLYMGVSKTRGRDRGRGPLLFCFVFCCLALTKT